MRRRSFLAAAAAGAAAGPMFAGSGVERWGLYEISLSGPASGNPFLEVRVGARFRFRNRVVEADGFYDGGGTYRIRFMPDEIGQWSYTTFSNSPALDGKSGSFVAVAPTAKNHGPARVRYVS